MKVLLTGITGLLGAFLAKELVKNNYKVYALARHSKSESATMRMENILRFIAQDRDEYEVLRKNIFLIEGDIVYPALGIRESKLIEQLQQEISIVYHAAAITGFKIPLNLARKVNVDGTKNLIDFALKIHKKNKLKKFSHISTMYIAGNCAPDFDENDNIIRKENDFNNTYELSKYEAEKLLNEYKKDIPISVFRPSIITGDSKNGKTNNFRLFYQPLHFFANQLFKKFPGRLDVALNLINIDVAASIIFNLTQNQQCNTFHVINPKPIKVKTFLKTAAEFFNFKPPKFIAKEKFDFTELTYAQKLLAQPFVPYLNLNLNFNAKKTFSILKEEKLVIPPFDKTNLLKIFSYCDVVGFIKKTK